MAEKLAKQIVAALSGLVALPFGKELIVFVISLCPILELRGGLIAASLLDVAPLPAYIISIIGNLLPVPFILLFIESILKWMENCKIGFINKFANWLLKKANEKKGQIETYGFWGLVLFVGIPLPGTGAWTGCLIASLLHMDKKKAFVATVLGVLIASIIMMVLSYGVLGQIIR